MPTSRESRRKPGRPKKLGDPVATNLLLTAPIMAALDDWVAELRQTVRGGDAITRADLVRDIIKRAVEERRTANRGGPVTEQGAGARAVIEPREAGIPVSRTDATAGRPPFVTNVSEAPREVARTRRSGEPLGWVAPLAAGLRGLRVHHEVLPPGRRSAPPHAHSTRDELVLVLEGRPELWLDGELHSLRPGDVVAFSAGSSVAHTLINRTDMDAMLFVVATTPADDVCSYPFDG